MIDATGKNLGVLPRAEALALARPEEGLDLIEIVPGVKPPVARIMSFDKYRYEHEKQLKKERRAEKTAGMKQIQISARAAANDLQIKIKQLEKFMAEGHQIEIQMRLRGREKYNHDWAKKKLSEFIGMIQTEHKLIDTPKFGGRGMLVHLSKK